MRETTSTRDAETIPLRHNGNSKPPGRSVRVLCVVLVAAIALGALYVVLPTPAEGLPAPGRITLVVFVSAVIAWISGVLDDTYVALAAVLMLAGTGVLSVNETFISLGSSTIWLLVAAFVLAAALTATGLPASAAALLMGRARTVRQLAHLSTLALLITALAVPTTSGRAALALPVFLALARVLGRRTAVVRALAVLFPTVILLTAAATLTGAAAHVITSEVLAANTGAGISYGYWLLLGLPFALVSAHVAAEVVMLLMLPAEDRRAPLELSTLGHSEGLTRRQCFGATERRALIVLGIVILLWCTESLHGYPPAFVALLGALLLTAPGIGTVRLSEALAEVPWALLLFVSGTATLAAALSSSGAARWLASSFFDFSGTSTAFLLAVVVISVGAHLVLQSRSARSSVLIPLLVPLAAAVGLNPAAVAFTSTMAAGFCHTLPSSAKPVAIFGAITEAPTYHRGDLLRVSIVLGPLIVSLVMCFAMWVWPLLGLSLR